MLAIAHTNAHTHTDRQTHVQTHILTVRYSYCFRKIHQTYVKIFSIATAVVSLLTTAKFQSSPNGR